MDRTGVISYPSYINDVAVYIGSIRNMLNHQMNNQAPSYKRGDKSGSVNTLGVLGELIIAHHLHVTGVDYEQSSLISASPVIGPDFIVGESKIDVKTINSDAPDLLVNVDAHLKKTCITHYIFVMPRPGNLAFYRVYSYNEVSKWPIKNVLYTNAYFKKLVK